MIAVAATGGGYGLVRGALCPLRMDAWVGQPVLLAGTVDSVRRLGNAGAEIDLTVSRLTAAGRDHACSLRVSWPAWGRRYSEVSGLQAGDVVRLRGVLLWPPERTRRGVPVRERLAQLGIFYQFSGQVEAVVRHPPSTWDQVRTFLDGAQHRLPLPPATQSRLALAMSVVFGGEDVSRQVRQAFLAAGLLHVLAASGANVLLLENTAELVLRPVWAICRIGRFLPGVVMLGLIWGFAGLCSFTPSITRAAWMSSYRQLARLAGRRPDPWHAFLFAAWLMTGQQPGSLSSDGALLSFLSTAAVVQAVQWFAGGRCQRTAGSSRAFGSPRVVVRLAARWLLQTVGVTLWVELAVSPMTMAMFGQITPFSLLSNVVADPLLALLLPVCAGFLTLCALSCLIPVFVHPAVWAARAVDEGIQILLAWVTFVSQQPGALLTVTHPPVWALFLYYTCVWTVNFWPKCGRKLAVVCKGWALAGSSARNRKGKSML